MQRRDRNMVHILEDRETSGARRRRPIHADPQIHITDVAGVTQQRIERELADLRAQRAEMQGLLRDDKLPKLQQERSLTERLLEDVPKEKEIAREWIDNLNTLLEDKTAESVKQAADEATAEVEALSHQTREAEKLIKRLKERTRVAAENETRCVTIRNRFDRNAYDLRHFTQRLEKMEREFPPATLETMKTELTAISAKIDTLLDIRGKMDFLDDAVRLKSREKDGIREMLADRVRYIEHCNQARHEAAKAAKEYETVGIEQSKEEKALEAQLKNYATQIEDINANEKMTADKKLSVKERINRSREFTIQKIRAIGPKIEHKKESLAAAIRSAEATLKTRLTHLNNLEIRIMHSFYRP